MITPDELYGIFLDHPEISTDSRSIIPGYMFFSLKGENFDGNRFAADALNKGASFAVIDNPDFHSGNHSILVPDVLQALQQLAFVHRQKTRATIIAITGSNGKTTTKELIGKILSTTFKTETTRGNFNNHIGVPLTLLSAKNDTEFVVVEMGANHPNEIETLCRIAQPEYGLITNIGKAHLEGFGGFEGVVRAKSELYAFLRQIGGKVFLNADNELLVGLAKDMTTISYGSGEQASCMGLITTRSPFLAVKWTSMQNKGLVQSNLIGEYNFENIMAAVCVGDHFGISPDKISRAIADYFPDNNRSQQVQTGKNTLILDAYNANPSSMNASLVNFNMLPAENKIIILGDMMELGDYSLEEHGNILDLALEFSFNERIFIGDWFYQLASGRTGIFFRTTRDAETWLKNNPLENKMILLKGSRKMHLETLTPFL